MTIQEAGGVYGKVPLLFSSYYKYSFSFSGTAEDGVIIQVSYGGNSDDIYKFDVKRDEPKFLGENPEEMWAFVKIEKVGEVLVNYHEPLW